MHSIQLDFIILQKTNLYRSLTTECVDEYILFNETLKTSQDLADISNSIPCPACPKTDDESGVSIGYYVVTVKCG